jgi:hypothetical protein
VRRLSWRAAALVAPALAVVAVTVWFAASQQRATVETSFSNCQQIEVIKAQIRGTVQDSQKRLPTIDYYRTHPAELRQAIKDSNRSIARFKQIDCYALTGWPSP